ncbi:hypothetical protein [Nitrosomonas sp.]|uniref:hypothetical protein n=1 Tax=Nitrosomonas sp. TaxID=42353 RepID=UPI00260E8257|nr:hypothetical protein [Nitrosomonas sp.]
MSKRIAFIVVTLLVSMNTYGSYFNTDRPQKIIGPFLAQVEHIEEIKTFSNAFGVAPKTASEITQYLNANTHQMLPVITISSLLFDKETGMYRDDSDAIIDAIQKSSIRPAEILFLMDEPLAAVRAACEKGKSKACRDVENRYVETLSTLRLVGQLLRKQFPGAGVMHIEAWIELVQQKKQYPNENVIMLDDAEYLGFDCYGEFDYCGSSEHGYNSQIEYGTWVWDAMHALESTNSIGRKMFLVTGAFLADHSFDSAETILKQMYTYAYVLSQHDKLGGLGIFLWSDMIENGTLFTGARSIRDIADFIVLIAQYFGVGNKTEQ